MRRVLVALFLAPALAIAAAATDLASAFTEAIHGPWERALAFARECLDLFKPAAPRFTTDGVPLVRSIDGNPVSRWLQQAMRYESPASYAASS